MAADVISQGEAAGEAARTTELGKRADIAEQNKQIDKGVVDLSSAVEDMRTNPNKHSLDGIGTNRNMPPEALQQVITEYFQQANIGVDLSKPFDEVVTGSRLSGGRRHDDFYYRSDKPEFKDMVFVIRFDHKSGTLERMDTVKVPQELRPGKEKLGWFAEKKWRGDVDDALVDTRERDSALPGDGTKPFTPETPKQADLKAAEKTSTKKGGAVLGGFGVLPSEAAKHKPKRRSWWLSLFG
jgi:hypothetical protein